MGEYFTAHNFGNMLFYGLQIAIIADLAARYHLKWGSLFLVGLLYGVLEEGFAAMTMESPSVRLFDNMFRVAGINLDWSIFISIVHATLTVVGTLMIVRVIWPDRVDSPFLTGSQYCVIAPTVVLLYALGAQSRLLVYVPGLATFATLGLVGLGLVLSVRVNQSKPSKTSAGSISGATYAGFFVFCVAFGDFTPILVSLYQASPLIIAVILLVSAVPFKLFFDSFDSNPNLTKSQIMAAFTVLIGFWLILGTSTRTPLSNIAAYLVVGLELYFGWRSARRETSLARSTQALAPNPTA